MKTALDIDLQQNKTAYTTKMARQITEAQKKVKELEKIAHQRGAHENPDVKTAFDNLKQKLADVTEQFDGLKEESNEGWAELSKAVSTAYKELESQLATVGTKVKPK
jgi:hypothetical protein